MADILTWVITIIGSLIIGAFLVMVGYLLIDTVSNYFRKRRVPKDKGPDGLADPGKPIISEKEVIEDERRKSEKFREFEKLRRLATGTPGTPTGITESDKLRERELLSYGSRGEPKSIDLSSRPADTGNKKVKRVTF